MPPQQRDQKIQLQLQQPPESPYPTPVMVSQEREIDRTHLHVLCQKLTSDKDFVRFIIGQPGDLAADDESIVGAYRKDCLSMLADPDDKKDKRVISAGLNAVNKLVEQIRQMAEYSSEQ